MAGFVSHFTNRLDAKGRVSIPAPFRAVLARDGFEGLYCIASPHCQAVDAGGNELLAEIEKALRYSCEAVARSRRSGSCSFFGASEKSEKSTEMAA
ncbi:hypothetical protein QW131_15015 [Roseibium salinum]|nr:hypothetical protein [Roseibium salinum]